MEEENKEQITVVLEDVEALKKRIIEEQFSEIYKMAEAQWKADSQCSVP